MRFAQRAALFLLRPYISRELPAWGRLYNALIGGFEVDDRWKDRDRRWIRGKLHGYEMSLDLGYWSNRATYFLGRFYDLPTQLVLKSILRPGDTFVDVGANEGMISLLGSRLVGDEGHVIAFEPNPKPRSIFQMAIDRNKIRNVTLHGVGLGNSAVVLQMTVPKINTGEGSFGKPNYTADVVDVIDCEVLRGDDVLSGHKPRLIKIDVEGFELHALQGLQATLERHKPTLIIEMVAEHLRNVGTRPLEIAQFLTDLGYSPFSIGLLGRHHLRMTPSIITEDVEGDYLWAHRDSNDNKLLPPATSNG